MMTVSVNTTVCWKVHLTLADIMSFFRFVVVSLSFFVSKAGP